MLSSNGVTSENISAPLPSDLHSNCKFQGVCCFQQVAASNSGTTLHGGDGPKEKPYFSFFNLAKHLKGPQGKVSQLILSPVLG